jgi:hypothetical protein
MIGKSMIGAMVLATMGLASPAFAQVPGPYPYYDYPSPYAYQQPVYDYAYGGWAPYGYSYWAWDPNNPHSIDNNIHTPLNH